MSIATYRKRDYQEIRRISQDKDTMEPTWEEWKAVKEKTVQDFANLGIQTTDILVTPQELVSYCRDKNMPINGAARAGFAAEKAQALDK